MTFGTIKLSRDGDILTLTLQRSRKLNALSTTMLSELKSALSMLAGLAGEGVRGMILIGEGQRAFVAGADIADMSRMDADEALVFSRLGQDVTVLMERLPFPVISAVDGFALGGGCELAMSADFIYATERSVFGQPEVSLGLIPCFGGCVRLERYVGPAVARELIYTGRQVVAHEAVRIGLVNRVFASRKRMLTAARNTLLEVCTRSRSGVAVCKTVMNTVRNEPIEAALDVEAAGFRDAFDQPDRIEGISAFLEKREPNFESQETSTAVLRPDETTPHDPELRAGA